MFSSLSEGFRHVLTREAAAAKLTNALALLGNTPEQVTDWMTAFAAYASVGGTIHDLETISYEIAIGAHKPQKEPTMTTETFTASNGDTIETRHDGYLVVKDSHHTEWLSPCTVATLREYFTAERDARDHHDD